jgi:hypothetical protein
LRRSNQNVVCQLHECLRLSLVGFSIIMAYVQAGTKVSQEPATLTGSILVVLVTFRTNNAYLRFDEARKMWGLLLNRSRDVVRQCISFFPEDDIHRKATFSRWTIALSQSLKCHLRPAYTEDLRKDLASVLCEKEMELLMTADHKVCWQSLEESDLSASRATHSIHLPQTQSQKGPKPESLSTLLAPGFRQRNGVYVCGCCPCFASILRSSGNARQQLLDADVADGSIQVK